MPYHTQNHFIRFLILDHLQNLDFFDRWEISPQNRQFRKTSRVSLFAVNKILLNEQTWVYEVIQKENVLSERSCLRISLSFQFSNSKDWASFTFYWKSLPFIFPKNFYAWDRIWQADLLTMKFSIIFQFLPKRRQASMNCMCSNLVHRPEEIFGGSILYKCVFKILEISHQNFYRDLF